MRGSFPKRGITTVVVTGEQAKGLGLSQQEKMRRILRKGYPFPMLAAEEASGKWVLICCACSLLKTRKGRERNGEETKNGTQ